MGIFLSTFIVFASSVPMDVTFTTAKFSGDNSYLSPPAHLFKGLHTDVKEGSWVSYQFIPIDNHTSSPYLYAL